MSAIICTGGRVLCDGDELQRSLQYSFNTEDSEFWSLAAATSRRRNANRNFRRIQRGHRRQPFKDCFGPRVLFWGRRLMWAREWRTISCDAKFGTHGDDVERPFYRSSQSTEIVVHLPEGIRWELFQGSASCFDSSLSSELTCITVRCRLGLLLPFLSLP